MNATLGPRTARAGANAAGWDACLDALEAVVDGWPVPPADG